MKKLLSLTPLLLFALLIVFLWRGLSLDPKKIPTAFLEKEAPTIQLTDLLSQQTTLSNQDFQGHVSLLNVWASWCESCRQEQALLLQLQAKHFILYGLNYKDQDANAIDWLKQFGNPYQKIGVDRAGSTAINWGVYGTPELFIIDKHGRIRGKQIGILTQSIINESIIPLLQKLEKEPA